MERDILDLLILYLLYIKFLEMCYHFFFSYASNPTEAAESQRG